MSGWEREDMEATGGHHAGHVTVKGRSGHFTFKVKDT